MQEPAWISVARKYLGQAEIKGPHHNPHILTWWKRAGAPFEDDETPWCGAFIAGVLSELGIKPVSGGASAQAWLKMSVKLDKPAQGCVVIFERGKPGSGSGHVGFVVGRDGAGNLMVLGGNQGDAVTIKPFNRNRRVLGYRWPGIMPYPERYKLPRIDSDGVFSTNEA